MGKKLIPLPPLPPRFLTSRETTCKRKEKKTSVNYKSLRLLPFSLPTIKQPHKQEIAYAGIVVWAWNVKLRYGHADQVAWHKTSRKVRPSITRELYGAAAFGKMRLLKDGITEQHVSPLQPHPRLLLSRMTSQEDGGLHRIKPAWSYNPNLFAQLPSCKAR